MSVNSMLVKKWVYVLLAVVEMLKNVERCVSYIKFKKQ